MTVAFTSLVAIFVIERVSEKGGAVLLFPAVVVGAASVAYWRYARLLRMAFPFYPESLALAFFSLIFCLPHSVSSLDTVVVFVISMFS
jgi:hypothetical protein